MGRRGRHEVTIDRSRSDFDSLVSATSFGAQDPGCRPEILILAKNIVDVRAAVRLAKARNWRIACCSGGHSWSQNHIRAGGMLIDLSRLNEITVEPKDRTATVGPGCLSGDLDAALARHALFFPVAHAYTVGLGGFLLQGGFGWNSRMTGLACESVIAVDVVLADGRLVHASETENADILWAARGAGPGFFGIVVRFHLRLHARPRFTGMKMQVFRLRHMEELLRWAETISAQVSPKVEFQMMFNRKALGIFAPGIEVATPVLADSRAEARDLLSFIDKGPLRPKASLTLPLIPLSLSRIMKAAEKIVFLPRTRWHCDNIWLDGPVERALPVLRRAAELQPSSPSHMLWMNWNPRTRQRPDMAFSLEGSTYIALYGGLRGQPRSPEQETWATDMTRQLEPFSLGSQLADENLARRPARFMAPANLQRLSVLRSRYDPDNRFFSYGHEQ
jgi:hypothetical protein